ncbi:hypothetical protein Ari01nite_39260 [Paractinoplanes rishiriensis]|uniref:DUF4232 domain-containing protein n=1 Tax=Paractinoplanes rishiriensis TaxID=1050105 RepID=A0A919K4H7_9ACTN|nr:hypothetical protein Ari01nite_39260 [Actinoplanes rishiriensis]
MPSRRWAVTVLASALAAGCAQSAESERPVPIPSEAFSLRADGAVPWADEPIESVHPQPAAPTVAPGTAPCEAAQLTGSLDRWWQPRSTEQAGDAPLGGQLIGEVVVRNTSATDCTLQGSAAVRLFSKGAEVPVGRLSSAGEEAHRRVVPVPAGSSALLRVAWSGPFCAAVDPPFELRVRLPAEGGEVLAPVRPREHPACSGNAESILSVGAFTTPTPTDPQAAVRSPLWDLRAAVSGPATARPGGRINYTVTLTNPTAEAVSLLPCPGYLQEVRASANGVVTASTSQLYRLNCRPVSEIAAHDELRFDMVAEVPAKAAAGETVQITWSVQTPQNLPSEHLVGILTVTVTT